MLARETAAYVCLYSALYNKNQQKTHHEMKIPERDVTYVVLSVGT